MKTLSKHAILAAIMGIFGAVGAISNANAAPTSARNIEVLRVGCGAETVACYIVVPSRGINSSCADTSAPTVLISWNGTTTSGKNITAAAFTSKAAGFNVNITYDNSECNGPNPRLIALTIA